jgi:phosphoglycerate kinase
LIPKADKILIGGGMTYTFYKAKGMEIGNSLVEADKVDLAKELIEAAGDKLVLPVDSITAAEFSNDVPTEEHTGDVPAGQMGLDIGPESIALFAQTLEGAKTVVWNGPMGVFEMSNFARGTIGVCEAIANLKDATTIIGGGDSAAAAEQLGFADKFTHISTGGGASLELLEGKELPGLAAINDK